MDFDRSSIRKISNDPWKISKREQVISPCADLQTTCITIQRMSTESENDKIVTSSS